MPGTSSVPSWLSDGSPQGGDRLGIPLVAQGGHLPVREERVLPAAVRPPGEVQMAIAALGADDVPEVG